LQGRQIASILNCFQAGLHSIPSLIRASETYFHHIKIGTKVYTIVQTVLADENFILTRKFGGMKIVSKGTTSFAKKDIKNFVDTLLVSAEDYMEKKVEVTSPDTSDMVIEIKKDTPAPWKPRIIVTTDLGADVDDEESLVHLFVCANEFDIEGLIVATGCHFPAQKNTAMLDKIVNAYTEVYENLTKHSEGYPTPEYLKSISILGQRGYGMGDVGDGKDSPGSELIIAEVDKDDPRPVWVQGWGGMNNLAQALWKVQKTRSTDELKKFISKVRGYDILGQDNAGTWVAKTFPDLLYIRTGYGVFGWQPSTGKNMGNDQKWIQEHVQGHGPLGKVYPLADWSMEGDTPAFLHVYPTGLNDPDKVYQGGWGGRFGPDKKTGVRGMTAGNCKMPDEDKVYDPYYMYSDAAEGQAAIKRWAKGICNDFQARMDWSIESDYSKVNHHPVAIVNNDKTRKVLEVTAQAGSEVTVDAAGSSDPDGHSLNYNWYVYSEPSTYKGSVNIQNSRSEKAIVQVPSNASGKGIHVILEVTDTGTPSLYAYRRVIINVQ
jgi:hypothetical protein